jgi:hypothetical protein
MCNTLIGFAGIDCAEICAQLATSISVVSISLVLALAGVIYSISSAVIVYEGNNKAGKALASFDPILLYLILASISNALFLTVAMIALFNTIGWRTLSMVTVDPAGRQLKRSPDLFTVNIMIYGFAAISGACTVFVLPLTWVGYI